MALEGWYYLHENGELIYKGAAYTNVADFRESDLVRAFWKVDPDDRECAWNLVVEALASGARPDRVRELADKWGCDDEDAQEYARRVNVLLRMDGDLWCATREDFQNLAESPAGFGRAAYEALAELAKALGYRPAKTWGPSFGQLASRPLARARGLRAPGRRGASVTGEERRAYPVVGNGEHLEPDYDRVVRCLDDGELRDDLEAGRGDDRYRAAILAEQRRREETR